MLIDHDELPCGPERFPFRAVSHFFLRSYLELLAVQANDLGTGTTSRHTRAVRFRRLGVGGFMPWHECSLTVGSAHLPEVVSAPQAGCAVGASATALCTPTDTRAHHLWDFQHLQCELLFMSGCVETLI